MRFLSFPLFHADAHHDTGTSAHKSGEKSRDREGARQGSKEGERDRGFVKEHKSHDSHDAAYDAKDRKFEDGERHSEGYAKASAASSSASAEKKHHENAPSSKVVYHQEGPPVIRQPPIPVYPHPIAYDSSDDKARPAVAYPPPNQRIPVEPHTRGRKIISSSESGEIPPQVKDEDEEGYVGYAGYRPKSGNHPILKNIRNSIRQEVKEPPPSYSRETPVKTPDVTAAAEKDKYGKKPEPEITQYGTHLGNHPEEAEPLDDYGYPEDTRNPKGNIPIYIEQKHKPIQTHQKHSPKLYIVQTQRPQPAANVDHRFHGNNNNNSPPRPQHERVIFQGPKQYRQQDYILKRPPARDPKPVNNYPRREYDGGVSYPSANVQQNVPLVSALGILLPKLPEQPNPALYMPQDNPAPQTNNKYSPVVILSRGPQVDDHALDVWYTRQDN